MTVPFLVFYSFFDTLLSDSYDFLGSLYHCRSRCKMFTLDLYNSPSTSLWDGNHPPEGGSGVRARCLTPYVLHLSFSFQVVPVTPRVRPCHGTRGSFLHVFDLSPTTLVPRPWGGGCSIKGQIRNTVERRERVDRWSRTGEGHGSSCPRVRSSRRISLTQI